MTFNKKEFTILLVVYLTTSVTLSHAQNNARRVVGESYFLSVGLSNGIQPNFRNEVSQLFYFGTLNSDFFIKNIPFSLRARISDEPFRAGQSSYFKLSFNPAMYKRYKIADLQQEVAKLAQLDKVKRDSLYAMEAQISFLDQKINEQKSQLTEQVAMPETNTTLAFDSLHKPTTNQLDQLNAEMDKKSKLLQQLQTAVIAIQQQLTEKELALSNIQHQIPVGALSSIQRLQVGMTSSVPSGLNGNGIPINGVSYAVGHNKWKEEGSIGITQRNLLFSSTIFDQITANSGGIFNSNQFFNNNANRLLINHRTSYEANATTKFGADVVYSGKSLENIKNHKTDKTSLTNNLFIEKIIGKNQQLTLTGLIGSSWQFNSDTLTKSGSPLAVKMGGVYLLRQIKSKVAVNAWNYGTAYDSYSQGCFRNGSKHLDGKFQKTINEHVVVDVFYMQDQFSSQNKTLVAQQVGTGIAAKIGTSFSVAGTYSLARTIAESKANNQLFQIAINHHKKIRKGSVTQQLRGGKVFVLIADTLQQITQMSHQLLITNGKLKLGVISTYEKYNGINRLYGQNIIVQPTLGFHSKLLQADMSYSFMKSQQFGMDRGMLLNIIISPAPNFYWKISGQRWLKKELIYFIENVDPLVKPWYLTISMNLKLK
jgi:hypothetical protein